MRELFTDDTGKLSSKRIIGTLLLAIAMFTYLDAYYTERTLNEPAFNSLMYTGGIMIIGGVLEGKFGKNPRGTRIRRTTRRRDLE